jgi:hypothetical protein
MSLNGKNIAEGSEIDSREPNFDSLRGSSGFFGRTGIAGSAGNSKKA